MPLSPTLVLYPCPCQPLHNSISSTFYLGKLPDELVREGFCASLLDSDLLGSLVIVLPNRSQKAKRNVVQYSIVEKEGFLLHEADL